MDTVRAENPPSQEGARPVASWMVRRLGNGPSLICRTDSCTGTSAHTDLARRSRHSGRRQNATPHGIRRIPTDHKELSVAVGLGRDDRACSTSCPDKHGIEHRPWNMTRKVPCSESLRKSQSGWLAPRTGQGLTDRLVAAARRGRWVPRFQQLSLGDSRMNGQSNSAPPPATSSIRPPSLPT